MDQEIREFYAQGFEPERLHAGGNGRLEFLRTHAVVGTFALEGVAWLWSNADLDDAYAGPARLDYLMWALRLVEQEESVLGASSHLITVAWRGGR